MKNLTRIGAAILLALLAMLALLAGCRAPECAETQGVSHITGPIDLTASSTAAAVALYMEGDSDTGLYRSAANNLDFSTGGTNRLNLSSSGLVFSVIGDLNGQKLDLDADGDTSITADTDDQVDWELGGADVFVMKDFGASTVTTDTTEYLFEILDTTNVMTAGTNSLAALNIDLGIGNSTAGTNSVYGILIDNISQDAQNTETAIALGGTGWDVGFDVAGNVIDLDADNDTSITADTDDQVDFEISGADEWVFGADQLDATDGQIVNIGAAGTDFTTAGGLTLAGPFSMSPGASDTAVVSGTTLTPVTSMLVITATSTMTATHNVTMASCSVAGQFVALTCNSGSSDITISEGSTLEAGGAIALDASEEDVVLLMCNGTKWLKAAAFADN